MACILSLIDDGVYYGKLYLTACVVVMYYLEGEKR